MNIHKKRRLALVICVTVFVVLFLAMIIPYVLISDFENSHAESLMIRIYGGVMLSLTIIVIIVFFKDIVNEAKKFINGSEEN